MRYQNFQNNNDDSEDNEESQVQVYLEGKTDQDRYIEMMDAKNAQQNINQGTMDIAVRIVEKSWKWRFLSNEKKLERINEMYENLVQML